MPRRSRPPPGQPSFFDSREQLLLTSAPEQFPNNYNGETAGGQIQRDLRNAQEQVIITGFSSLEMIIDYLAVLGRTALPQRLRLLIGHEPAAPERGQITRKAKLSRAVADYWLERNVSILQCSAIVAAIEVLRAGQEVGTIEVRTSDTRIIHAKIYCGDGAITTGSSNFSRAGLARQIESNVRFTVADDRERFLQLQAYSEWVWTEGREYGDALIALLDQLLKEVSWQEALARACAEVLEGEWARRYIADSDADETMPLWPTQRHGIAQALWIMENLGSVLVADATGSGKTRMGAHLIKAAIERIWRTGQKRVDAPVLACPRSIEASWRDEFSRCQLGVEIYTHGILSRPDSKNALALGRALRQVQVIAIDEAHNFLDHATQRTRTLYGNVADYVVLFTATPINKGIGDLVALIDILGADNFDDETIDVLDHAFRGRGAGADQLSHEEQQRLRRAIERFMVRRTILMLNDAIAREPTAYRDASGRPCRYPEQDPQIYRCPESPEDQRLSEQISEEADRLRGLVYLGMHLKPAPRADGRPREAEEELATRIRMAGRLAAYHVISCLRSSRAALIEHIEGTERAQRAFSLPGVIKAVETGNHLRKLAELVGHPPTSDFPIPLPAWLSEAAGHEAACNEEIETYQRIAALTLQLSDVRETSKAKKLGELLQHHQKIVAFDWHLITLSVMAQQLTTVCSAEILLATGSDTSMRARVRELFDPDVAAPDVRAVALCSDAMSESIGLQRASAIIHLDLPSTIRKAEQRLGRLMRMNSPHSTVEVFWPAESAVLTLRSDSAIVERHETVVTYIGANLKLPPKLASEIEVSDQLMQWADEESSTWDNLGDAFAPVRALVQGETALIPDRLYAQMRTSTARVISSVSVVESARPWAFFAIAGTEWGSPRWAYLDDASTDLVVELDRIAGHLRDRLDGDPVAHPLDQQAMRTLQHFVNRLIEDERLLLPKKKQRALDQMESILAHYRKTAQKAGDRERVELSEELLTLLKVPMNGEEGIDLRAVADCWLRVITPRWTERLRAGRRYRPLRIRDLSDDLKKTHQIPTSDLRAAFENAPLWVTPLDRRIVSAIIGVLPS